MRASLVSREVIADSIELVARGHLFDGLVCLVACDKTNPGAVMALARLDIPSVVLYTGSIAPGVFHGRDVTVGDVYEAIGAHAAGKMTAAELHELESVACPGAGACGGQFTANTMGMVSETLGLALPGSSTMPAVAEQRLAQAREDANAARRGERLHRFGHLARKLGVDDADRSGVSLDAVAHRTPAYMNSCSSARERRPQRPRMKAGSPPCQRKSQSRATRSDPASAPACGRS